MSVSHTRRQCDSSEKLRALRHRVLPRAISPPITHVWHVPHRIELKTSLSIYKTIRNDNNNHKQNDKFCTIRTRRLSIFRPNDTIRRSPQTQPDPSHITDPARTQQKHEKMIENKIVCMCRTWQRRRTMIARQSDLDDLHQSLCYMLHRIRMQLEVDTRTELTSPFCRSPHWT